MSTPEKRQGFAAMLRRKASKADRELVMGPLSVSDRKRLAERLADLIDPVTTIHWEGEGPGAFGDDGWAVCDSCGEPVTNVRSDMPRYCMGCGRRILGEGDR